MSRWIRLTPACLLGLLACAWQAAELRGQAVEKPALRAVNYDGLGRLVRSLGGKVVVVYFWSFG